MKSHRSYLVTAAGFSLGLLLALPSALFAEGGKLRAAAAKIDITPDTPQYLIGYGERISNGEIYSRLYHRILTLDDGARKLVIVSTDICVLSPTEYRHVAEQVQKTHGIDPVDFLWATTHTHSGPEVGEPGIYDVYMPERNVHSFDRTYTDLAIQKLIDGIGQTLDSLQPARLGVGWGTADANINRRERTPDGKIRLGQNPDGPRDRMIGILKLMKRDSDEPIATLANYAMHGTVLGGKSLIISSDGPGEAAERVEEKTGAPMLYLNGAAGNIAPLYSVYSTPEEGHLREFRSLLGDPILAARDAITSYRDTLAIQPAEAIFETPRKEGLGWSDDMAADTRNDAQGQPLVRLRCRFIRLADDILIWTAPVELFCEYSMAAREHSPFANTFYFGYTNGWFGYLPTAVAFEEGGYESTRVTPFTPAVEKGFTDFVRSNIEKAASATKEANTAKAPEK